MMKNKKIIAVISVILVTGVFFFWNSSSQNMISGKFNENKITVFKSPACGCCVNYIGYLKKQGFQVETINMQDMSSIKEEYNIPRNMESCHTAIVGDYFVEGHVPIEAVMKILEENPDIEGIALPNMPSGSPGMPGSKTGAFRIYGLSEGIASEFVDI